MTIMGHQKSIKKASLHVKYLEIRLLFQAVIFKIINMCKEIKKVRET